MPVRLPVSLVMDRIKRGTALQLLTAVRKKTDPPGGTFISALDDHILSLDPVSSFENETSTLHRGDVIEIQGPAASGKTQLLYFLAVTCIVPHSINVELNVREISSQAERGKDKREVNLGGRGKSVIVLDCDGRWRMKRLYTLLHSYLTSYFENAFDPPSPTQDGSGANVLAYDFTPSIESVAQKCLSLIHIFKPKTSLEVATTLLGIPSYHRDHMPNQEILMLFIDSMSAFHHDDKRRIEQAGYADRNSNGSTKRVDSPQLKMMRHTLDAIQNLRTSLGVVTFLTNWALIGLDGKSVNNQIQQQRQLPKPGSTSQMVMTPLPKFFGQHLLQPYPRFGPTAPDDSANSDAEIFQITHHITLHPSPLVSSLAFPTSTTFEEALEDIDRARAVLNQKVFGIIRSRVRADGGTTIKEGYFEFSIKDKGFGVD